MPCLLLLGGSADFGDGVAADRIVEVLAFSAVRETTLSLPIMPVPFVGLVKK